MAASKSGSPEVLVVGAGPVGLTMACELARHGVACRIVNENPGPTDQSRALGIQARTLEVFEDVGVVDEVLAEARKLHGFSAFAEGRRITHITFDLEGLETPYPYLLILPQSRTEHILIDRLRTHGIEVERRTRLQALAQDGSGVSATLADGEGTTSEVRVPWLVGSDGARSVVRKALGLSFEGAEYEESFLLADVRLSWDRPDDEITAFLAPEGQFIAFPFNEPGRWRLVHASFKPIDDSDAEPSKVVRYSRRSSPSRGTPRRSSPTRPGHRSSRSIGGSPASSARAGASSPGTRRTFTAPRAARG